MRPEVERLDNAHRAFIGFVASGDDKQGPAPVLCDRSASIRSRRKDRGAPVSVKTRTISAGSRRRCAYQALSVAAGACGLSSSAFLIS